MHALARTYTRTDGWTHPATQTHIQTHTHTKKQTHKHTNTQTNRQTDKQRRNQTTKQTNKHSCNSSAVAEKKSGAMLVRAIHRRKSACRYTGENQHASSQSTDSNLQYPCVSFYVSAQFYGNPVQNRSLQLHCGASLL